MAWITPKTDWVSTDTYGYSDLNRVENNIDAIADLIETYAARPAVDPLDTTRTLESILYYDALNIIEGKLNMLKAALYEPPAWITPKTTWTSVYQVFDYADANRLEGDLLGLYTLVIRKVANLLYPSMDLIDNSFYPASDEYDVLGVEA